MASNPIGREAQPVTLPPVVVIDPQTFNAYLARLTTECVKIVFRVKRTPFKRDPSVMPVAAKLTSPQAMSCIVYLRSKSMPAALARAFS